MTEQLTGKRLVQRFQKYAHHREVRREDRPRFSEQLREGLGKPSHAFAKTKAKDITLPQAKRLAHYAPLIQEAARKHNVPVELICGVILQESGGKPEAVSKAGAKGLMQLMPATAKRFGVKNAFDPAQNIEGGTRYLRWLLDRFDGKVELAVAGYNAGEGAVDRHGGIPPYAETKQYVPNVLGYTQSMIDILIAQNDQGSSLPTHARRV